MKNKNKTKKVKQCKAINKQGKKCIMKAKEGSDYCWRHQKQK